MTHDALCKALTCTLLFAAAPFASAEPAQLSAEERRMILVRARAEAGSIENQALALARIAWPNDPAPGDHELRAFAREELVQYGHDAFAALRAQLRVALPVHRADIAAAILGARRQHRTGLPPDFLSGLEDTLWSGSPDAQRISMKEISRYRYPPALLPILDAVAADPRLRRPAILALGRMSDDRAAGFLGGVLESGPEFDRRLAARSLAQIGGRGLDVLRGATRSTVKAVRLEAVRALVPIAGLDDLTVLHEFVAGHAEDDPEVLALARDRLVFLESLLEAQQGETAAPGPN